jgi:hypothetical protein
MIVPLTRPASEFQLTRSPTLKLFIMSAQFEVRGRIHFNIFAKWSHRSCARNCFDAARLPRASLISGLDAGFDEVSGIIDHLFISIRDARLRSWGTGRIVMRLELL